MTDIFSELKARGLVSVSTDEAALQKALNEESLTYYVGFDPTAPSLHMGNLVQLITAARLQKAGHNPLALVGGATGLIGDPRMSGERTLNPREVVEEWLEKIRAQVEKFLDFSGPNAAQVVNNYEWTSEMSAIDFLRDIGKHFPMNRMLAKESVSARLNSEAGISFTEFSYQVLQGNDYLELHRRYGCSLQTGGSDQWGNLTSGVDLIRRVEQHSVHALATPLITKADGTKFGKTESGTVWLDESLTSPYAFSQFWLNADDRDVVKYLKVFSFRSLEEIEQIEAEFTAAPHTRLAQKVLAEDVTTLVHGKEKYEQAIAAASALFGGGELASLDASTLGAATSELPRGDVSSAQLAEGVPVADAFVTAGIVKSKGEARRAIKDGGAYVNNVKVTGDDQTLTPTEVLPTEGGGVILLRRGKKTLGAVDIIS
ncbi:MULTISPECIES: tyrosine--tRNA ligase [Brevibacterium]|uniref:Tyrosine--tRNA ligase n=2 Tax=Brevibacterium aurantiacum TaxID=273384 RepID=A0A1D7W556_BREAU|nr:MULTISPECIES: tyrosine--tRNA ligase [Brevibacterium]MDN5552199.1 tyrosine--tRNA ligase [Brevibacterium sp.]AOP54121.1 Tyrosyl-tRNA synthetase [Brevibacterium aurantiacum]AZL06200.1 tyrosine--tRNA ligase [Brevibacterium aurantiacum]AZT97705.1 tyrosine--tRNA ligase [Brevibacterium aurantiacum]MDN5609533.1 tyrosine--tRNA ligase [Brevibacterium sp.]